MAATFLREGLKGTTRLATGMMRQATQIAPMARPVMHTVRRELSSFSTSASNAALTTYSNPTTQLTRYSPPNVALDIIRQASTFNEDYQISAKAEAEKPMSKAVQTTVSMCTRAREVFETEKSKMSLEVQKRVITRYTELLKQRESELMAANQKDCEAFQKLIDSGKAHAHDMDRLQLNPKRITGMISDALGNCTIGSFEESWSNLGMQYQAIKPIDPAKAFTLKEGPMAAVFERRPNVLSDLMTAMLRAGRPFIANGSSSAIHSNTVIIGLMQEALKEEGLDPSWVQLLPVQDKGNVLKAMVKSTDISATIVRGGDKLIKSVRGENEHHVIITGQGNCHKYIHSDIKSKEDLDHAARLLLESKIDRFVCNSLETAILHKDIATEILTRVLPNLVYEGKPLTFYAEGKAKAHIESLGYDCRDVAELGEEGYDLEFEGPSIRFVIVDNAQEAIQHIQAHGTNHTESIITHDESLVATFASNVTAGLIVHGASTRHSDGSNIYNEGELGIVTEIEGPKGSPVHPSTYPLGVWTGRHLLDQSPHAAVLAKSLPTQEGGKGGHRNPTKFAGYQFSANKTGNSNA